MSKQIEAMKLALEALERLDGWIALRHGLGLTPQEKEIVTALREALAEQPSQQEPVAFSQFLSDVVTAAGLLSHGKTDKALAARISEFAFRLRLSPQPPAQPAPRQPLTDEMVTAAARALNKRQAEACGVDKNDHWKFYGDDIKEDARAVLEAAHGITKGNT